MSLPLAIPGVRCGKRLGRITAEQNAWSRRLHEQLRKTDPGREYRLPKVCDECLLATIIAWPDDEGDEHEKD